MLCVRFWSKEKNHREFQVKRNVLQKWKSQEENSSCDIEERVRVFQGDLVLMMVVLMKNTKENISETFLKIYICMYMYLQIGQSS